MQFPCSNCGAMLEFDPGTTSLKCVYCGVVNEITADSKVAVEELDLVAHLNDLRDNADVTEALLVRCDGCGAEQTLSQNVTAAECVFCGKAIVAQAHSRRLIKPQSLLPFKVTQPHAVDSYNRWIHSLWFAPNELKRKAERQRIFGSYLPAWTYDSDTTTPYRGQRGEHYYETQTYTAMENGRRVTRTRRVRKTRWYPASGVIRHFFDDVLVLATTSLPPGYGEALEPWDLGSLCPFDERYLSGFTAEAYQVDLPQGWTTAQQIIDGRVQAMIRRDIGGDEQRIDWYQTRHGRMTFKHVLLPVWISAYTYHQKAYVFLVNGRTGEVQGQRPYSWVKITLFALLIAAIVTAVALFANQR
jgi:LSD1 subclass zinc finger protein